MRGIDHCVVATRADKIPKTKLAKTLKLLAHGLGLGNAPITAVSALKNTGLEPLYEWIGQRAKP